MKIVEWFPWFLVAFIVPFHTRQRYISRAHEYSPFQVDWVLRIIFIIIFRWRINSVAYAHAASAQKSLSERKSRNLFTLSCHFFASLSASCAFDVNRENTFGAVNIHRDSNLKFRKYVNIIRVCANGERCAPSTNEHEHRMWQWQSRRNGRKLCLATHVRVEDEAFISIINMESVLLNRAAESMRWRWRAAKTIRHRETATARGNRIAERIVSCCFVTKFIWILVGNARVEWDRVGPNNIMISSERNNCKMKRVARENPKRLPRNSMQKAKMLARTHVRQSPVPTENGREYCANKF